MAITPNEIRDELAPLINALRLPGRVTAVTIRLAVNEAIRVQAKYFAEGDEIRDAATAILAEYELVRKDDPCPSKSATAQDANE